MYIGYHARGGIYSLTAEIRLTHEKNPASLLTVLYHAGYFQIIETALGIRRNLLSLNPFSV
jgi:hypothetical protein